MKVTFFISCFLFIFSPFLSYAGVPDTTIISLDSLYSLHAVTVSSEDKDGCYGKTIEQTIFFMCGDSLITSIEIPSISALKTKDTMDCHYLLYQMGSTGIDDYPLYHLFFYLANGEPEIHLFYDKGGKILFAEIANKRNSKYIMYDFDEEQALKYLDAGTLSHFVDIDVLL